LTPAIAILLAAIVGAQIGIAFVSIHAAILVVVFVAVGNTPAVGICDQHPRLGRTLIGIRDAAIGSGIRSGIAAIFTIFGAIQQAIPIAVFIQNIEEQIAVAIFAWIWLQTIEQAIVVAIRVIDPGTQARFQNVAESVAIGVCQTGVICGVAYGRIRLLWIYNAIAIAIFRTIAHATAIRVRIEWRCFGQSSILIGDAVPKSGIGEGIGAQLTGFGAVE